MTFRNPLQISRNFILRKSFNPVHFPNTQVFPVNNKIISFRNALTNYYCTGRRAPRMDILLKTTHSVTHSINTNTQSGRWNTNLKGTYHTFPNVNYTSLLYAKAQFITRRFYSEENYCKKAEKKKDKTCCDPCKDTKASKKIVCGEKPKKVVCLDMKVPPCKPRFRPDCVIRKPIPPCTKTEAPYGSFGECCDDGYLPDMSECNHIQIALERSMQPKFQKTIPVILMKINPPLVKQVDPSLERKCLETKGCSEEEVVTHEKPKPFVNPCRTFKLKGCKPRARTSCEERHESPPCNKLEAPYECFSDCCPQFPEVEFTECDQQEINVKLQRKLFYIGLKKKNDPCAQSKSGGKSGCGSSSGGSSGGNPCAMKQKEKKPTKSTCACEMKKEKDPCAKQSDPCKPAKKAADPCAKPKKDPCAKATKVAGPCAKKKKDPCATEAKDPCATEAKDPCAKFKKEPKKEKPEKKKCERIGTIQSGGRTMCVCPPPPPPKIAPNPCNPDACKKKEEGSSKKEDPCKKVSAKKSSTCKTAGPSKQVKKKPSMSSNLPRPPSCKSAKSGTNSSVCERKKPKNKHAGKLIPKMSLWDRIVNYFKARPNCPAPDDYKKKEILQKASKLGLKLCPECPPKPKCPAKPKCPDICQELGLKKTTCCKVATQATKDPCKVPSSPCGSKKFSTCSNAYSSLPSIIKADCPGCEQSLVNYSTQMRHNYYSKNLADKYIGKMYQLRLQKIGLRNALVKEDTETLPHTVCYICKFVPKKQLLTQKRDSQIDLQPMKTTEKNRPTF